MENNRQELGKCPECGKPVYEGKQSFYCSGYKEGCNFALWKNSLDRLGHEDITPDQATLLLNGESIAFTGLKSKAGNEFDAQGKLVKNKIYGWQIGLTFNDTRQENKPCGGQEKNEETKDLKNGIINKPRNKKNSADNLQ